MNDLLLETLWKEHQRRSNRIECQTSVACVCLVGNMRIEKLSKEKRVLEKRLDNGELAFDGFRIAQAKSIVLFPFVASFPLPFGWPNFLQLSSS